MKKKAKVIVSRVKDRSSQTLAMTVGSLFETVSFVKYHFKGALWAYSNKDKVTDLNSLNHIVLYSAIDEEGWHLECKWYLQKEDRLLPYLVKKGQALELLESFEIYLDNPKRLK